MITVFTSCYNQGECLEEAVESVLAQTYDDFEYLLFDDGSTDGTWEIMQTFARKDDRITATRLEKQDNVGVVINKSIDRMRGDVWVWCPSDDVFERNLLHKKRFHSIQKGYENVIYSKGSNYDTGKLLPIRIYNEDAFPEAAWGSPIGFTGIWIPKLVFRKAGLFPTHLKYSEDYYWMMKAVIQGVKFSGVSESLYKKRYHANANTARTHQEVLTNLPKIKEELREYEKQHSNYSTT